jgi:hypothetical protein
VVAPSNIAWSDEAQLKLRNYVADQPVLIQISVAKTLRDNAERIAQGQQLERVSVEVLDAAARDMSLSISPEFDGGVKRATSQVNAQTLPSLHEKQAQTVGAPT